MYAWFWRTLPGGTLAKLVQSLIAAAVVLALLMFIVFPWASQHVPFLRVTVEDPAATATYATPASSRAFGAVLGHDTIDEETIHRFVDAR